MLSSVGLIQPNFCLLTTNSRIQGRVWAAEKKKLGVVVKAKAVEKPRLVLRFIWMDNNIGIAVDRVIPGGRGTIPVTPYYFWPKKDVCHELKLMMDNNPWISHNHMQILLNQASNIINLWNQTGHNV